MSKATPEVIEDGQAACIFAPMGDNGLEGYQHQDTYRFQRMRCDGQEWFRVYPDPDIPDYYETCGPKVFPRYFQIRRKT